MTHYLISLTLPQLGRNVHGYLMSDDRDSVERSLSKMLDEIEKKGLKALPLALVTELSTGVDLVQGILKRDYPEAASMLAKATDFHLSVFSLSSGHPDDKKLMELH